MSNNTHVVMERMVRVSIRQNRKLASALMRWMGEECVYHRTLYSDGTTYHGLVPIEDEEKVRAFLVSFGGVEILTEECQ